MLSISLVLGEGEPRAPVARLPDTGAYSAAVEKELDSNHSTEPHTHGEAADLHILNGQMGFGSERGGGMVTVSLTLGSTINGPAGCRHFEQVGAEGVRVLVSRR